MRWVFFSLLVLNVVYLLWRLVGVVVPEPESLVPPQVVGGEPLVLLSEAGVPAGLQEAAAGPAVCSTLGPWSAIAQADAVYQRLLSAGYQGRLLPVRVMKDRLFWVYLPPVESQDQALKVLRELQARDVDSFIVSEAGADQNAISLGYFSTQDSARGLSVKMQSEGYPAQVRETAREVTEYWLAFSVVPDQGGAMQALVDAESGLVLKKAACDPASLVPPEPELTPSEPLVGEELTDEQQNVEEVLSSD